MSTKPQLENDDLFALVDLLGIELKRDRTRRVDQLSGGQTLLLRVMEGLNFPLSVTVLDSGVYPTQGKVGVVVHVCGSLFLVLLVNAFASGTSDYIQVWAVDGGKLGWSHKELSVFPAGWHRQPFYRKFMEGVVCGYRHLPSSERHCGQSPKQWQWFIVDDARQELLDYVASKASGTTESQLSDQFRTVGPRGV